MYHKLGTYLYPSGITLAKHSTCPCHLSLHLLITSPIASTYFYLISVLVYLSLRKSPHIHSSFATFFLSICESIPALPPYKPLLHMPCIPGSFHLQRGCFGCQEWFQLSSHLALAVTTSSDAPSTLNRSPVSKNYRHCHTSLHLPSFLLLPTKPVESLPDTCISIRHCPVN